MTDPLAQFLRFWTVGIREGVQQVVISRDTAGNLHQGLAEMDDLNLDARLNVSATDAKIAAKYWRLGRFDEALEAYSIGYGPVTAEVNIPPGGIVRCSST